VGPTTPSSTAGKYSVRTIPAARVLSKNSMPNHRHLARPAQKTTCTGISGIPEANTTKDTLEQLSTKDISWTFASDM
jgi:hypothetical protein